MITAKSYSNAHLCCFEEPILKFNRTLSPRNLSLSDIWTTNTSSGSWLIRLAFSTIHWRIATRLKCKVSLLWRTFALLCYIWWILGMVSIYLSSFLSVTDPLSHWHTLSAHTTHTHSLWQIGHPHGSHLPILSFQWGVRVFSRNSVKSVRQYQAAVFQEACYHGYEQDWRRKSQWREYTVAWMHEAVSSNVLPIPSLFQSYPRMHGIELRN